jgi:hypothetical protein
MGAGKDRRPGVNTEATRKSHDKLQPKDIGYVRRLAASCLSTGLSVTVAMTVLTACATDAEKHSEDSEDSGPTVATCAEVWVEGATLPATYEGCMDGESLVVPIADAEGAIHYDDRFKAQPGGVIKPVK